jgi:hypothetical protein
LIIGGARSSRLRIRLTTGFTGSGGWGMLIVPFERLYFMIGAGGRQWKFHVKLCLITGVYKDRRDWGKGRGTGF